MPTYLSPAKLNLGLLIVGKRDDNYHLLESVFCLIDLFDQIEINITINNPSIVLVEHNQAWAYKDDLAYRAAKLLQSYTQSPHGAKIKLKKHIPVGSGMGGGSSNAATILLTLNQLWQTKLTKAKLQNLALSLGADVPFFIYNSPAYATGIGEILSPIDIPQYYFVLIQPNFQINTTALFSSLNYNPKLAKSLMPKELLESKHNDLLSIAIRIYPELKTLIGQLETYGKVYMTGSGSTLYLCFSKLYDAKKVAKILKKSYNIYLVKNIQSSPLQNL